jgi:hypothetical protein
MSGPITDEGGDQPIPQHLRPEGVDDATVAAAGKVSEALECVEEARGLLYAFHRRTGEADLMLGDGLKMLRAAGHDEIADRIDREIIGRNVIQGRWTFQIVEEYDDTYYEPFKAMDAWVRDRLMAGRRHVFESEMKEQERKPGRPHMDAVPHDGSVQAD